MPSRSPGVVRVLGATWLLTFAVIVGGAILSSHPQGTPGLPVSDSAVSGLYFDHIVVVIMENKNLCDLYTHCSGSATYMTNLADAYSMLLDYRYANVNPSLPNYLALSGGTDFGCSGYDGPPHSNGCTNTAWNAPNIVDRLETGGVTWKAYMEDMPSNCYGSNSGGYAVRHNPFVYYNSIVGNAGRCARVVPAGSGDSTLLNDLSSNASAPNYMWLTPNKCNDMHDCTIAIGDAYLSNLVPQILGSTVFRTTRAALFLVFDEGYSNPTWASWAGPVVKTGYTSSTYYDAYSFLKTIETNWNLYTLTSNDANAATMDEFFKAPAPPPPDTTPPMVTISSPLNNSELTTADVLVTGTAFDNVALQNVELSTTGSTWTPATGTASWSGTLTLVNGTYTIHARATDTAGNTRSTEVNVTVNITSAGPSPNQNPTLAGLLSNPLLLGILIAAAIAAVGAVVVLRKRSRTVKAPGEKPVEPEPSKVDEKRDPPPP